MSATTPFPDFPEYEPLRRPYLSHFFFVEKVLTEQDMVPSYIRVIDMWAANGSMPPFAISPLLSIGIKGLEETTDDSFSILAWAVETESSPREMVFYTELRLTPGEGVEAMNFNVQPQLALPRLGLYRCSMISQGRELGVIDFEMRAAPIPYSEYGEVQLVPRE